MPKPTRTSQPPTGALQRLRNTRLYGSRDEQIEGAANYARGCPSPDRAIVRKRRPKGVVKTTAVSADVILQDCTPRQHANNVARMEHNMRAVQLQVQAARERGDEARRAELAQHARELRAEYLKLTGGVESRAIVADMPETWASGQQ